MKLNEVLEKRHCIRKFKKNKKVSFKEIGDILDSVRYAPCAGGIFTVKVIVIDQKELKDKIADACLGQTFIADAPYLLVVCSDMEQINKSYGKRAEMYARQQAGAAIENMLLKLTEIDLASCWIGAFDDNAIKRAVHAPDSAKIEAVLPIGYSMEREIPKEKIELRKIIRFNSWKVKWEISEDKTATGNE